MHWRHARSDSTIWLLPFVLCTVLLSTGYARLGPFTSSACLSDIQVRSAVECIGATDFERSCAEKAAAAVNQMYRQLGFLYSHEEPTRIFFMDTVSVGSKQINWALAIYNRCDKTVRICRYRSDIFQKNDRFDGCSRRAVYYSILAHEFAHSYNSMISPDLPPAVDEAIAGFVQYSLMDPALREHLLKKISSGFGSYRDVVLSNYINGPDDFLGSAYLYLKDHPSIIRRWLLHQEPLPKDPLFM